MTRPWIEHLPIGDILPGPGDPVPQEPDEVGALAAAMGARLRSLPHHPNDIVLRNQINDLTQAVTPQQFNDEFNLIGMWGDQSHVRVLLCTGSTTVTKPGRPFCQQCVDWFAMHPAHHPAFEHPELAQAMDIWCDLTGTEPDEVRQDADFIGAVSVLDDAELLAFRNHDGHDGTIGPTAYANAARLAALVLLAGAHLAELRGTPIPEATARVWAHVRDQLGRPTGYEGEPDRLARLIHNGTPRDRM